MLFLLKVEVKQMPQMSVKDFLGYVIREWEYFSRFQRRGKILAGGKLAGRRGRPLLLMQNQTKKWTSLYRSYHCSHFLLI